MPGDGGASSGATAQEILPPPPSSTPTARRLTLEEARQLALQNNPGLALARLNVTTKEHATAAARKDYFPKLLGNLTYFHFNENLGTVVTAASGATGRFGSCPGRRHQKRCRDEPGRR